MTSMVKNIKKNLYQLFNCVFIASMLAGCSTVSHHRTRATSNTTIVRPTHLKPSDRLKIATIAGQCIGKSKLAVGKTSFRADCSGAVRAIFAKAKIGLGGIIKNDKENDVKAIYRYAQKYGQIVHSKPEVGDLVFFHNTYDRSRNGRMNDALTHVGIVEKVDGSTVHFIHHLGQSIIRSRMDLSHPKESYHPATKKRINHILRKAQGPHKAYTAAELFAGFGRL